MMKTEECLRRVKLRHGDRYSYPDFSYNGPKSNITLLCKDHGLSTVKAKSLLQGSGCKGCAQKARLDARHKKSRELTATGKKKCPSCKATKPFSEFSKTKDRASGCVAHCKPCSNKRAKEKWASGEIRDSVYRKKFGITLVDYENILVSQGGCCAICKTDKPMGHGKKNGRFSVDHDHKTGKVRGLLCHHCNVGIGSLKDDLDIMVSSIRYLMKHSKQNIKTNISAL